MRAIGTTFGRLLGRCGLRMSSAGVGEQQPTASVSRRVSCLGHLADVLCCTVRLLRRMPTAPTHPAVLPWLPTPAAGVPSRTDLLLQLLAAPHALPPPLLRTCDTQPGPEPSPCVNGHPCHLPRPSPLSTCACCPLARKPLAFFLCIHVEHHLFVLPPFLSVPVEKFLWHFLTPSHPLSFARPHFPIAQFRPLLVPQNAAACFCNAASTSSPQPLPQRCRLGFQLPRNSAATSIVTACDLHCSVFRSCRGRQARSCGRGASPLRLVPLRLGAQALLLPLQKIMQCGDDLISARDEVPAAVPHLLTLRCGSANRGRGGRRFTGL